MKKILCVVSLFLWGCAIGPVLKNAENIPTLAANRSVYVAQGQGSFSRENAQVQRMFAEALAPYTAQVFQSTGTVSFEQIATKAETLKNGYIFYIDVLQWEDHNTPWTTIRDKVTLHVSIIEVPSQRIVFDQPLQGKSELGFHNNTPDVLAKQLVSKFVNKLFQ